VSQDGRIESVNSLRFFFDLFPDFVKMEEKTVESALKMALQGVFHDFSASTRVYVHSALLRYMSNVCEERASVRFRQKHKLLATAHFIATVPKNKTASRPRAPN